MVMTDPDRRRRRLSLALLLVLAALSILTYRYAGDAASTSKAIKASDDRTGCLAQYRSLLDTAEDTRDELDDRREDLFLNGLVAATSDQDAELERILVEIPTVQAGLEEARAEVTRARKVYADASALARSDPDGFLDACEEHFPT